MGKKNNYFSIGSKLFWGLILLVTVFALLKLNPGIFNGENTARDIIVEDSLSKVNWEEEIVKEDSSEIKKDTSLKNNDDFYVRTWRWESYDGKNYTLNFKIKRSDYSKSSSCRESSSAGVEIWSKMYNNDKSGLKQMVNEYKNIIIKNNLNGIEALNMVVSSVQSIPYVLITPEDCPDNAFGVRFTNDCRPRKNQPDGCCGFVLPWGVYSPIEYAVNGSGDCDTKSLFACTILKELNLGFYEAEMLIGEVDAGTHAMLGVNILNPPYTNRYVTDITRNKFYAWEATSPGNELGQHVWNTWNNWVVVHL